MTVTSAGISGVAGHLSTRSLQCFRGNKPEGKGKNTDLSLGQPGSEEVGEPVFDLAPIPYGLFNSLNVDCESTPRGPCVSFHSASSPKSLPTWV